MFILETKWLELEASHHGASVGNHFASQMHQWVQARDWLHWLSLSRGKCKIMLSVNVTKHKKTGLMLVRSSPMFVFYIWSNYWIFWYCYVALLDKAFWAHNLLDFRNGRQLALKSRTDCLPCMDVCCCPARGVLKRTKTGPQAKPRECGRDSIASSSHIAGVRLVVKIEGTLHGTAHTLLCVHRHSKG